MNNKYNIEQITLGQLKELANNTSIKKFKQIQLDYKFINVNIELNKRICQTYDGKTFVKREVSLNKGGHDRIEEIRIFHFITGCLINLLLTDLPNLKYFSPIKTREGMNIKYTVLPANNGVE